ncbi:MAG: hypothetical protein IPN85_01285 [Flavobacteriales bacterium]|nr:hypothetical protein [Flavobacteriales bacterium]
MRKALRLRTLSSIVVLGLVSGAQAQNVGINVTGAAPNASALLDLDVSGLPAAGKRGMLIPRMLRADRLAIPAPTAGLWVYQTDDVTAPVFDPAEEHGFWYYEGPPTNDWVRWANGRSAWTLNGNAGTVPTLNYLGTIGATPLNFRTVSPITVDPQMQFLGTTRMMGINTVGAPLERLDVNGAMRVISSGAGAGSATNQEGTIRFTASAAAPNRWHFGSTPMQTRTGNTVLGSPTVTLTGTVPTPLTLGLSVGMTITGTNIPPGSTVLTVVPPSTITISNNATATGANFLGLTTAPGNWARLENAEALVTVGGDYAKDTLTCPAVPFPGFAVVGPTPGTNSTSNAQTPFATNATATFPIPCGAPFDIVCSITAGSAIVTPVSVVGLAANMFVIGIGIPANARILSVGATTFTMTVAASATNPAATLSFTGFANTAYSTPWTGAFSNTTGRGYRAQYIYTAAELTAAGLCAGYITSFGWYALDDDCNGGPSSPFTQGKITIEARIGTTANNDFATAPGTFVDAVRTSVQRNWTGTPQTIIVSGGWNQIPLNINPLAPGGVAGYFWDGVSNIVLDWSWIKQAADGRSPRVWVHNPAIQPRTRIMRHPSGANGNLYDDAPVNPATAVICYTNELTRPVTRFGGNIKTTSYTASTASYIHYAGGLNIGDAVWSAANYRGPGTVSAQQGVYDGNSQLNDHVFDRYFDGSIREEDAAAAATYDHIPLRDLKPYLEEERHLPNMPSREEWDEQGAPSLGQLQNGLWQEVETQALYITELERDLGALETLAFGEALTPEQVASVLAEIERSPRLTEQQKLHLVSALKQRTPKQ